MKPRNRLSFAAGVCLLALLATFVTGTVWASFGATTDSSANSITAASDFVAPTVSRSVISKTQGGTTGYIKQGGSYYVYADSTDAGNPASGIASETANVSTIGGSTSLTLTSGSFTAGGLSYNYRSASTTAPAALAANTYSYSVTSTDDASNSRTQTGYTVTVDNTAPSASNVQTQNGPGTAGRADLGDTVTFTFSEPIEPASVISGWTGASTNVVVRINTGGFANDVLQVYDARNSSQLPMGTVNLGRLDYVFSNLTFGASGTPSTMSQSGSTITVTLGTPSTTASSGTGTGTMTWTPGTTPYDRAANNVLGTSVRESGPADREF